jgi:Na+/proline symporter
MDEFFNYGQRLPLDLFTKNFITTNVTFTSIFVAIAAATYQKGNQTLWIVIAWVIGLVLFRWLFPRVSGFFDQGHTLHEFLSTRYNNSRRIRFLASACTIVAFLGTLGIEFWGVILLLDSLGLRNYLTTGFLALIVAVITGAYTALGGFKAAVATDRLQYGLIVGLALALIAVVFNVHGLFPSVDAPARRLIVQGFLDVRNLFADPLFAVGMFVMFVPFNFCVMDMWQRCSATPQQLRSKAIRSVTSPGTILAFVAIFSVPILIGLAYTATTSPGTMGALSTDESVMVVPRFLQGIAGPSWLRIPVLSLIYGGFAAALLSTADTVLVVMAYSLLYDIVGPARGIDFRKVPLARRQRTIWLFRFWVCLLVLLSLPVVYLGLSMYQMVLAVFSSQVALFVPIVYAILRPAESRRRERGAWWAILVGFSAAFAVVTLGSVTRVQTLVDAAPLGAFLTGTVVFFSVPKAAPETQ